MLAMREGNTGNGAYLQEKLDYAEQIVRDLALVIIPSLGERASAWEIANRVCDSYCLPKARASPASFWPEAQARYTWPRAPSGP